jgi:hypothetical protein
MVRSIASPVDGARLPLTEVQAPQPWVFIRPSVIQSRTGMCMSIPHGDFRVATLVSLDDKTSLENLFESVIVLNCKNKASSHNVCLFWQSFCAYNSPCAAKCEPLDFVLFRCPEARIKTNRVCGSEDLGNRYAKKRGWQPGEWECARESLATKSGAPR